MTTGRPPGPSTREICGIRPEAAVIARKIRLHTDGFDPDLGQLDAGLFFIAYQRDAHKQFVPIQTRLGQNDELNEYIVHRSSGLFAVPPGIPNRPGRYVGDGLFS